MGGAALLLLFGEGVIVPSTNVGAGRLEFTIPACRLEYSIEDDRLEFTLPKSLEEYEVGSP